MQKSDRITGFFAARSDLVWSALSLMATEQTMTMHNGECQPCFLISFKWENIFPIGRRRKIAFRLIANYYLERRVLG